MYGGIYCFLCQDYIYDKDIEIIAKEEQRKAWKMQGLVFRSSVSLVVSSPTFPAPHLSGGGGRSPHTCLLLPASSGGAPREAGAEPTVSWTCAFAWVLTGLRLPQGVQPWSLYSGIKAEEMLVSGLLTPL